jgi:hypothetical protein
MLEKSGKLTMVSFANLPNKTEPDPAVCPLCGKPNNCAVAANPDATECWCEQVEFPEELLAQIPEDAVRKTCVCQECLNRFTETRQTD